MPHTRRRASGSGLAILSRPDGDLRVVPLRKPPRQKPAILCDPCKTQALWCQARHLPENRHGKGEVVFAVAVDKDDRGSLGGGGIANAVPAQKVPHHPAPGLVA